MFSYIKGVLVEIETDQVIVDNGGIGYIVSIPKTMISKLPAIGETIKLHIHMQMKEDAVSLYGFLSKEDLLMFQMLIGISGIGPKGAINILSIYPAKELIGLIADGDAKSISAAPGIGLKTAQRLILECKGKLENFAESKESKDILQKRAEAEQVLEALGYTRAEAKASVKGVKIEPGMTIEEITKLALLSGRKRSNYCCIKEQ